MAAKKKRTAKKKSTRKVVKKKVSKKKTSKKKAESSSAKKKTSKRRVAKKRAKKKVASRAPVFVTDSMVASGTALAFTDGSNNTGPRGKKKRKAKKNSRGRKS